MPPAVVCSSDKVLSVVDICGAPADVITINVCEYRPFTESQIIHFVQDCENGLNKDMLVGYIPQVNPRFSPSVLIIPDHPSVFCYPSFNPNQGRAGSGHGHRWSSWGHTPLTHAHQEQFRVSDQPVAGANLRRHGRRRRARGHGADHYTDAVQSRLTLNGYSSESAAHGGQKPV